MIYDVMGSPSSLRSRAIGLLWFAIAVAGCSDPKPFEITTTGGSGGAGGSGGTAGALPSAGGSAASGGAAGVAAAGTGGMHAGAGTTGGAGVGTPEAGASAAADGGGGSAGDAGTAGAGGAPDASFPPVDDLANDGPYTATTVMSTGPGGTYTIYRPEELAPGGATNPIVGWMSGGGAMPSMYTLLPHLASHGFVVVASNTSPQLGAEAELGEQIIAGIDWVLAENAKSDSEYYAKIDPTKIAAMGFSMGALATTMIAGDPRLTTTVHISGGNMTTDRIKMLHAPAAFLCGASGVDIAGAACETDFEAATAPVFYGVFNGGGHLGVTTDPYAERIRVVVTGWLRWQLMRDVSLATMFVGDACTVCEDADWTVKQKGLM